MEAMDKWNKDFFIWLDNLSKYYAENNLAKINLDLMRTNRIYALKCFLNNWAYERAGAPKGYKIAAIKTAGLLEHKNNVFSKDYKEFYSGKLNIKTNPGLDDNTYNLDIPDIINRIKNGDLSVAFNSLAIRGVGHKIRSFFIRDIVTLLETEYNIKKDIENYLFVFPIDIWLTKIADSIKLNNEEFPNIKHKPYRLDKKTLNRAIKLIYLSLDAGVSPLRVNQGAWYFASRIVADTKRLEYLINSKDISLLNKELALMKDVL
jgi:hypothetical protein